MSLNHEKPDRCPMQVSFTPEFAARLRAEIGLADTSHNPHGGGNTYELERALDEDRLLTSVGWANSYYANDKYAGGQDSYIDEWGVGWRSCEYTTPFGIKRLFIEAGAVPAQQRWSRPDSMQATVAPP